MASLYLFYACSPERHLMKKAKREQSNRIEASIDPVDLPFIRFTRKERESLRRLANSSDVADRKRCVDYISLNGTNHRQNYDFVFEMCDILIADRSQYVRWQSQVLLRPFTRSHPQKLWPSVMKWGSAGSHDIRSCVACCLLEHILEHHFSEYFPKIESAIKSGNKRLLSTLKICDKIGWAEETENAERFDRLIAEYGKANDQ